MAVLKPRTKVVFFRVSEEEFHQMEEACSTVGARSISDFARTAARELMKTKPEERVDKLAQSFEMMYDCLERLHKRFQELYRLAGSLSSPEANPSLLNGDSDKVR